MSDEPFVTVADWERLQREPDFYYKLLRSYIEWVGICEGTDFIHNRHDELVAFFTPEQVDALERMARAVWKNEQHARHEERRKDWEHYRED